MPVCIALGEMSAKLIHIQPDIGIRIQADGVAVDVDPGFESGFSWASEVGEGLT